MRVIEQIDRLREQVNAWRAQGERIAFVPTMGALHAGHMALVEEAHHHAEHVVVSIFVNPTQFGPNEDFSRYPRTLEDDKALLEKHNADVIWLPDVSTMYPEGFATHVSVSGVSEGLCGAARPGHFDGVALVVSKLLMQVMPDIALFGEKDYQQLSVIRRLVADLNIPVTIKGVPTIREPDGLALSSRNRYLSTPERAVAPVLYRTLQEIRQQLEAGKGHVELLQKVEKQLLEQGFQSLDYIALADAHSLAPIAPEKYEGQAARLLAAARLGTTRLIDNVAVGESA